MRLLNYFIICILVRLFLTYLVYKKTFRYVLALVCLFISLGFMYQYVMKTRTIGAFHNKVWWDGLRPIHSFLFLFTSLSLYYNYSYAYMFLLLDTMIGIIGFIHKNSNLYNK